jgi:hypothetical protein
MGDSLLGAPVVQPSANPLLYPARAATVAPARAATVARDLAAGNLVAAYGLTNPAPDAVGSSIIRASTPPGAVQPGRSQPVHETIARQTEAQDPVQVPAPDEAPAGPQAPKGPQGIGQSGGVGGGMANPLFLIAAFVLIAVPCLRLVTQPVPNLNCVEGHRLERPG